MVNSSRRKCLGLRRSEEVKLDSSSLYEPCRLTGTLILLPGYVVREREREENLTLVSMLSC